MTSFRQIEANRRNARKSTGPITEEGKQRSRCNAIRHGLTAETVIGLLEDAEDYQAFEAAITAGFDAETAVERELVLRLASLLWRLRRATAIDTGLLETSTEREAALDPESSTPENERAADDIAHIGGSRISDCCKVAMINMKQRVVAASVPGDLGPRCVSTTKTSAGVGSPDHR